MQSHTTRRFRAALEALPIEVRESARKAFELWKANPYHPGLQFKQIHNEKPIYSARAGKGWRALGIRTRDTIVWFWIGPHAEYDKMIKHL